MNPDLSALVEFATPRQLDYIQAIEREGSQQKAAKALGVNRRVIDQAMTLLRSRAASRGHSPKHDMTHVVPDGFKVKGVSTYYNEEGKAKGQWVKSAVDQARAEEIARVAVEALTQEASGLSPLVAPPPKVSSELMLALPIGDPHVGMYAWAKETGDDFDVDIARRITLGAVDRLMASTPSCGTAVIILLGDVFHANDQSNQTPGHKHQLDVDTRFVNVLQVGIETYRHMILRALERNTNVVVRCVRGNHDPQAIWALAFTLSAYFSNDPRVVVDLSPSNFWYYRFGKVLIGATHGDTVKHDNLLGVMASDRPQDWGETKHRYFYTGHVHHQSVREYPGLVCESFRTLAAKDAYAAGHGYRAGRDMVAIVHHREHGEIERHRCDIGMIT